MLHVLPGNIGIGYCCAAGSCASVCSPGCADTTVAALYVAAAVQGMYKASKKRFDEDAEFKERARKAVTMLQRGDAEVITAWERICEASRKVSYLPEPVKH